MSRRDRRADAADAVRSAVDRTFQVTLGQAQVTRERAQELVDELAQATGRVRDLLEDLRVATKEDVKALRAEVRALERRVGALEATLTAKAPAKRAAAKRPAAAKKAAS